MISDLTLSRAVFDVGEHRQSVCRPKLTRQFGVTFLLLSIFLQLSIDRIVSAPNPQFTPTGEQNRYPKELEKVLLSADKFYLFSLDPNFTVDEGLQSMHPKPEFFAHRWRVLDRHRSMIWQNGRNW
jgi:hypothetical protein